MLNFTTGQATTLLTWTPSRPHHVHLVETVVIVGMMSHFAAALIGMLVF